MKRFGFVLAATLFAAGPLHAQAPAARQGDPTSHGGVVTGGLPTVVIAGKPAARVGDMAVCPLVTGVVPHVGGPITIGSATVLIGGLPAARVGDTIAEVGPPSTVVVGAPTVVIGG